MRGELTDAQRAVMAKAESASCETLKELITGEFNKAVAAAKGNNLTDVHVLNTLFNELKALARDRCKVEYSIEWSSTGPYLHGASVDS